MKAIIHLSNGNFIELGESATQSLGQAISNGETILTFTDSSGTLNYALSINAIALIEYKE